MCGHFVFTWISRFGVPDKVTSDRGTRFYSLTRSLITELVHRQIKDLLLTCSAGAQWPEHLSWVLLGRADPKEDTAVSSAKLLLAIPLHLRNQLATGAEVSPQEQASSLREMQSHQDAHLGPKKWPLFRPPASSRFCIFHTRQLPGGP